MRGALDIGRTPRSLRGKRLKRLKRLLKRLFQKEIMDFSRVVEVPFAEVVEPRAAAAREIVSKHVVVKPSEIIK